MNKSSLSNLWLLMVVFLLIENSDGQYKRQGMYSRLQNHQNKRALQNRAPVPRVNPVVDKNAAEISDSASQQKPISEGSYQDIYSPPVYQQPPFVEGGARRLGGNGYQDPYQYNPQPSLYHGNTFNRDSYQPMNQYNPYLSNQPLSNQPPYYNNPYPNPVQGFNGHNQPYFKGKNGQIGGNFGVPYQPSDIPSENRLVPEVEDTKDEGIVSDTQENFNQQNFGRDQYGQGFGLNVNQMRDYGPNTENYGRPVNNYPDGGYNFNYKPQHQGIPINQVQPDGFQPGYFGNDQFRNLPLDEYQPGQVFNENSFPVAEKPLNEVKTGNNNKQPAVEDCNNCPELKNCLNITDTDCCPKCEQYGCICQGYQSYDCIDKGYKDKKVPEGESYNVDGGSTVCNCPMGGGQILCSYVDSVESSNVLTIKCMPVAMGCYKTLMRYDGCEECLIFGCEMNGVKTKAGDRYQSDECTDCFCPDQGGELICRQKDSCNQNKEQDSMRNLGYESGYNLRTDPRQGSIQYADDPNQLLPNYGGGDQIGANQFMQEINPYDQRFPGKVPLDDRENIKRINVQNGMINEKNTQNVKVDEINLENGNFNQNPYVGYGQNSFNPDIQHNAVYPNLNSFENNYGQPIMQNKQKVVDYPNDIKVKTEGNLNYFGTNQDHSPLISENKLETDGYTKPELNEQFPERNQYVQTNNKFQLENERMFEQNYHKTKPIVDNTYFRPRENDLYGNPIVQPNIVKLEHNPLDHSKSGFVELDSIQTQKDKPFKANLNSVEDSFKEGNSIVQKEKANDEAIVRENIPENIQNQGIVNQNGFPQNQRFGLQQRFPQPYGPYNPYQYNPYMQNVSPIKKFPDVNSLVPPLSMDNTAAIPPQLNPYLNNFGANPNGMVSNNNQFAKLPEKVPQRQEIPVSADDSSKDKFVLPMYSSNENSDSDIKEPVIIKEKELEEGNLIKTFSNDKTQTVLKDTYTKNEIQQILPKQTHDSVHFESSRKNNIFHHRRKNKISSQQTLAEKLNLLINKNKIKTEENHDQQNTINATSKSTTTQKTLKTTTTKKRTTTTQRPTTTTKKPTTTTQRPTTTTQKPTTTTLERRTTTTLKPTTTEASTTTTQKVRTTTTEKPTTTTKKLTTTTTVQPTTLPFKSTTTNTQEENPITESVIFAAKSSKDPPINAWHDINQFPDASESSNQFETLKDFKNPTQITQTVKAEIVKNSYQENQDTQKMLLKNPIDYEYPDYQYPSDNQPVGADYSPYHFNSIDEQMEFLRSLYEPKNENLTLHQSSNSSLQDYPSYDQTNVTDPLAKFPKYDPLNYDYQYHDYVDYYDENFRNNDEVNDAKSYEEVLNFCCQEGTTWGKSHTSCQGIDIRVEIYSQVCSIVSEKCCTKQLNEQSCDAGIHIARNMTSCDFMTQNDDQCQKDNQKTCCDCCALGLKSRNLGLSCEMQTLGQPCSMAYTECCKNGEYSEDELQGKFENETEEKFSDSCHENNCDHECAYRHSNGTFRCQCRHGFYLHDDKKTCLDTNECALGTHNCGSGEMCFNSEGGYECRRRLSCGTGYVLGTDNTCQDVDECLLKIDGCRASTTCLNIEGSFRCVPKQCGSGFVTDAAGFCIDINECFSGDYICPPTANCFNTKGSYECQCRNGYQINSLQNTCEDIDECASPINNNCDATIEECENTEGSYKCIRIPKCDQGYQPSVLNDTICVDIDECEEGLHNCHGDAFICVNLEGAYECREPIVCQIGWKQSEDLLSCVDVDECMMNSCGLGGFCVNNPGSYECVCNQGWQLKITEDGYTCEDVNECTSDELNPDCEYNCVNTQGNYFCECPTGYSLTDDKFCQDIDECALGRATCSEDETCFNTKGSFKCVNITCPANYDKLPRRSLVKCVSREFCGQSCLDKPRVITHVKVDLPTVSAVRKHMALVNFKKDRRSEFISASIVSGNDEHYFDIKLVKQHYKLMLVRSIQGPWSGKVTLKFTERRLSRLKQEYSKEVVIYLFVSSYGF